MHCRQTKVVMGFWPIIPYAVYADGRRSVKARLSKADRCVTAAHCAQHHDANDVSTSTLQPCLRLSRPAGIWARPRLPSCKVNAVCSPAGQKRFLSGAKPISSKGPQSLRHQKRSSAVCSAAAASPGADLGNQASHLKRKPLPFSL